MKKLLVLLILIVSFSIFVFADELQEIFTSNNVYETNIAPDLKVDYIINNEIGYISDSQGRNCNINLNGLISYSKQLGKGKIEIFFEKQIDNLLTLNSAIPKFTITGDEDCINNLNWDTVRQEYFEAEYDDKGVIKKYIIKPQSYEYSKKIIDRNTQEITISLNSKYSESFKIGDKLVIDPIYELSNITYETELNNVACEGGLEYCHSALNDSDIVLYMPFDVQEDSSNITYDFSSYNNDGTLNNMGSSDSPSGWNATGGINETGAYEFDGVDDKISTSSGWIAINNTFTISSWVYVKSTNLQVILSANPNGVIGMDYTSGALGCITNNDAWKSGGTIPVNQWTHVVCTYNGSNSIGYINGNQAFSLVDNYPNTNPTAIAIGTSGSSFFLNGTIDEVMIFNRSLEADEILQLYNAQFGKFYSQGNLTTNETTIEGKYSNVNLTIHSQNQAGADLNCSIYDGTSWTAYQNMTNELPTEFNISSSASTTALNTSCIFLEDPYASYTPILLQNITYETWNNPPTIDLVSPLDNNIWNSSNDIYFVFNCNDLDNNIINASLIIDGNINKTTAEINNGLNTTITQSLDNGDYNWTIQCVDSLNDMAEATARNISVSYNPPPSCPENITRTFGLTWQEWQWDNPTEENYSYTDIYFGESGSSEFIESSNATNYSNNYLYENQNYELKLFTTDNVGNQNTSCIYTQKTTIIEDVSNRIYWIMPLLALIIYLLGIYIRDKYFQLFAGFILTYTAVYLIEYGAYGITSDFFRISTGIIFFGLGIYLLGKNGYELLEEGF